jgi:hypothetical protein
MSLSGERGSPPLNRFVQQSLSAAAVFPYGLALPKCSVNKVLVKAEGKSHRETLVQNHLAVPLDKP